MITVIDYGMGNLASILNLCRYLGIAARVSGKPEEIATAAKLLLPGVGAFGAGMRNLHQRELVDPVRARVREGIPLLGICLGMQLLSRGSEESSGDGLDLISASTVRFSTPPDQPSLRVPHMGWACVSPGTDARLFTRLPAHPRFYFVHSYHVVCDSPADIAAHAEHGRSFVAAIQHQNIFGTQFHPEKSHRFGMQLMRNFARL